MPPRSAVLQWPNGKKSAGRLTQIGTAPVFFATEVKGPLARRCDKRGRAAATLPGPLEVDVASTSRRSGRIQVTPRLMASAPGMDPDMLRDLADIAGGGHGRHFGTMWSDDRTLARLMPEAVRQIAGHCTDHDALGRALRALDQPFVQVTLASTRQDDRYEACDYVHDPDAGHGQAERLRRLEQGEHLMTRVRLECEGTVHRLAISATRLSGAAVQVSLINSNGWALVAGRRGFKEAPAIAKTVSLNDACLALESLYLGMVEPPADFQTSPQRHHWHQVHGGVPLYTWLRDLGGDSSLQPTPQRMAPQKSDDCGIEMEFAWLASVLPKADYKLAKAHVLNVLLQAAMANGLHEDVVQRLRERVTTSLSAHAMATGG